MRKVLSWSDLEGIATKNELTAYLCCDDFETVRKDVKKDNPDISVENHKIETMWRLLYENLNYGRYNEVEGESDDVHSENMEHRAIICDEIAKAWCYGEIDTLDKAQCMANKLLEVKND